jgi:hypothetical protein
MLKGWIAERFLEEGRRLGLRTDISMSPADTLLGDDWYRFLLRCRFTIGAEGGASILDRDGRIRECVTRYRSEHTEASFEEIEQSCFPGLDGTFDLRAITPRHLEACATRTPQILIEGSYNGILEPGTHYISLRADFSNVGEVLEGMARGEEATDMAERAYRDVVATGRYSYESFVATLLSNAPTSSRTIASRSIRSPAISAWAQAADRSSWALVWVRQHGKRAVRATLQRIGLLDVAKRTRARRQSR